MHRLNPRSRCSERGNSLVLSLIVLTALATLSGLTVVTVQGGLVTTSNDRFHSIANYAAESGGAIAMEWLRAGVDNTIGWTAQLTPSTWTAISGNNAQPDAVGNPFSTDQQAWYAVEILNNKNDAKYTLGTDSDRRVIIRSTGHGPNGAIAVLEWEVQAGSPTTGRPCPSYGQKNMSEDGAGRTDCIGAIDTTVTKEFTPQ